MSRSLPSRLFLVLVLALLAAAGLSSCGGGGDSDQRNGESTTQRGSQDTNDARDDGTTTDTGDTRGDGTTDGDSAAQRSEQAAGGDDSGQRDETLSASTEVILGPAFVVGGDFGLHFGDQAVGSTTSQGVALRSHRGEPRRIVGLSIQGPAAADYALTGGDCRVGHDLGSGEPCIAVVTFRPSQTGERRAVLQIEVDPGVTGQVPLYGEQPASDEESPSPGPSGSAGDDDAPPASVLEQEPQRATPVGPEVQGAPSRTEPPLPPGAEERLLRE